MISTTEMADPKIDVVDREIKRGFLTLIFTPELEQWFEKETQRERAHKFILNGQIATVLYDLFLLCDRQMTPDVFTAALIVRLGVFTPLFLIVWYIVSKNPSKLVREGLGGGLAIISVALAMGLLVLSRSPDLAIYEYGSVLIMLFTAVVQRLRFRYAATAIVAIFMIQLLTTVLKHDTPRLMMTSVVFFLTAGVLLLWTSYTLEREQRRSYLLDLRSRILNDHLDQIAKQDALTGLWNRRHLDTVMAQAWARADAGPRSMSVILLDIDHFKVFNDSHGHIEGDACLKRIGACVRSVVGRDDKAIDVRFGGEEFLVFLDGVESATATRVAEQIQAAIKTAAIPHPAIKAGAVVTASFGVATGSAPELPIAKLVLAADDALYLSKRSGRDRISPVILDVDESPSHAEVDLGIAC